LGFGGDVHHVVELEVDAHELELGAILSFVVHLPTWVRYARNNMYIYISKMIRMKHNSKVVKGYVMLSCSLFHQRLLILGLYKIAQDKSEMQSCDMKLVQVPTKG
jgi:hypothetical protein